MEAGVIVYAFIIAGFITLCGVVLFVWINRRESELDNQAYEDNFDPGSMVEKYRHTGKDEDAAIDPTKAFRRYAQPVGKIEKPKLETGEQRLEIEVDGAEPEVTANEHSEANGSDTNSTQASRTKSGDSKSSGSETSGRETSGTETNETETRETETSDTNSTETVEGSAEETSINPPAETAAPEPITEMRAGDIQQSEADAQETQQIKKERDPSEFAPPKNKSE